MRITTTNARRRGFSLIELLITITVFAIITAGILTVFDNSGRLARSQTQLAVMQQGLRVGQAELVRYVKAAGLGGLPITRLNLPDSDGTWPPDAIESPSDYTFPGVFPENGLALEIHNNIAGVQSIFEVVDGTAPGCNAGTDNNCVVPGSDVLIVRGVFTTPIYYIAQGDQTKAIETSVLLDDAVLDNDSITLKAKIRASGDHTQDYPQDLAPLVEVLREAKSRSDATQRGEAFILRDTTNPNAYVIAQFDHDSITLADIKEEKCTNLGVGVNDDANPNCLTFPIKLDETTAPGDAYAELSTGSILQDTPGAALASVRFPAVFSSIGLLEEYRFFIRIDWEILPPPLGARLRPVLSRARFLPGTNVMIDGSLVDVAENVIDLQLAVGVDTDDFGDVPDFGRVEDSGNTTDEVLFNAVGDNTGPGTYAAPPDNRLAWFNPEIQFHYLRINTVVESAERERGYAAPELTTIEDFDRGVPFPIAGGLEPGNIDYNSDERRGYRRRWLQTVVELRNLL